MIGFALAHLHFRGKPIVLGIILAGLMLPAEAMVLPQFIEFRAMHLLGTYWALVLPAVAAPVAVFVFYSFLRGIPVSLVEAARLDGASWWRVYRQVCMPLCRPAISAVAILTFVTTWNAFLWPLLVLTQTKSQTIPVGLSGLIGGSAIQFAETMAPPPPSAAPGRLLPAQDDLEDWLAGHREREAARGEQVTLHPVLEDFRS